jgi:nucleoid DNA-binding protein
MNPSDIKAEVASKSGLPRSLVAHILDSLEDVLREAILRGQEVNIGKLIRISSVERTMSTRNKMTGERKEVRRILLTIRPRKPFRKELNQWLSLKNMP